MPSNHNIWDMNQVTRHLKEAAEKKVGVISVSSSDPYTERILKDELREENVFEEVHVVLGKNVTRDWIDENLFSLDLFATSCTYYIIQAHEIKESIYKHILERFEEIGSNGKQLVFWFGQKSKFAEQLKKKSEFFSFNAPKFWEYNHLLSFLMGHYNLKIEMKSQQYLLDTLEQDVRAYYQAVEQLRLYKDGDVVLSHEQVLECFSSSRFDQFELAQHFGRKELVPFFEKLMKFGSDYQVMDSFFYFMESHVLKLLDPTYIESKSRPSKYDRQVQQHSQIWKKEELSRFLNVLGNWMVLSKKKDPELVRQIRQSYLRLY